MRLAFLADIHGNLPALEAVIADLQQVRPDAIYLVGDQVNRCPWNSEVMALIMAEGWPAIAGNHDLVVGAINTPQNRPPFTSRSRFPTLWWTQENLSPSQLTVMRSWPEERELNFTGLPPIRLLHGIPGNAFIGILPEDPDEKIRNLVASVVEPVIVCGHTHRPLQRTVDNKQIFNGGSIGIPYNSDPRAQYLVLDGNAGAWHPTFRQVDYDHSAIPDAFEATGFRSAIGPIAELHLRTVMSGEPWTSDFGFWLRFQPDTIQQDLGLAIEAYLLQHGPGNWAFRFDLA